MMSAGPSPGVVTVALVCLCVQNTALILSMRYSRSVLQESYLSSTAIVMMELFKCIVSYAVIRHEGGIMNDIVSLLYNSLPMLIPSAMYVMQNSLQFLAITHLDASTFAILSQLKILTTAVCSVLMLGTHLSFRKWRGLMLLVIGAILVQYPEKDSDGKETSVIGLAAVLGMVCLSGLAGIYLEKYLKNSASPNAAALVASGVKHQPTLWERNLQLSLYGVLFALCSVFMKDEDRTVVLSRGFFSGYSAFTWLVIVIAGGGGLIVAMVVKYTSTIVKGFATSISIIVTSLISLLLFPDAKLSMRFWMGTGCVLLSIFNYNEEELKLPGAVLGGGAAADRKQHATHNGSSSSSSLLEQGVNGSSASRGLYKLVPDSPPNEEEQQDDLDLQARK